ncbi:MAG TPA: histidine kinase dimerization/phospho-acceptor domain-containing protein, partial [Acidimicrobiales bacterium]|nr:histidine kinase dimerization/phospho-acceptor domain-containing protein [Acidimicrobiales bacterium]
MIRGEYRRGFFSRRSVRARIALACAGLFLVMGGGFGAAAYGLVDRHPGPTAAGEQAVIGQMSGQQRELLRDCESALHAPPPPAHPVQLNRAVTAVLAAKCEGTLAGGARLGSARQLAKDLRELLLWSLVGLAMGTVLAGILGWVIGRRILSPLHKVTNAARRASQERLDERIRLDGPDDELKELADTFDEMLDRLDRAFASQRRFVANASHELRTPLTSMRTLIDVAMAKPTRSSEALEVLVGQVRAAIDRSDAIINGLLTLARSDRGLTTRELVDLEAAAQDAIDQTVNSARASNVVVRADLFAAPVLGDRVLLERLV